MREHIDLSCSVDLRHGELSRHGVKSKMYRARKGSFSLKTTVPDWIVDLLDIDTFKPQKLVWQGIFNEDKPNAVLVYIEESEK